VVTFNLVFNLPINILEALLYTSTSPFSFRLYILISATDYCDNLVITVCTNFNHQTRFFLLSLYCSLWFLIHGRRERLFLLLSSSPYFWWGVPSHSRHIQCAKAHMAKQHTNTNRIQKPLQTK